MTSINAQATPRRVEPVRGRRQRASLAVCVLFATFLVGGLAAAARAQGITAPQELPTVKLHAGVYNINAQLATTPSQRQTGLMYRTEMKPNDGMLFVFEQAGTQCFWMRNTLIPLAIAFVADDGRIVNLDEMKPQRDDSHCSTEPVRYVLEMNTGWFSQRGLKAGDRLGGPPFARPASR